MDILSLEFLAAILSIVMIDIVLSGDNAVVIAMAACRLPQEQQKKAIFLGTFGAIFLRIVFLFIAVTLLKIPLIKLAGGLLLIWIAFKLLKHEDQHEDIKPANSLLDAVKTIIIADAVMSLDNVLGVAGAAGESYLLLVVGIAISIPIMIFCSRILAKLMSKYPIILIAGAAILAYTAGEMIVSDKIMSSLLHGSLNFFHWLLPLVLVVSIVLFGRNQAQKQVRNQTN